MSNEEEAMELSGESNLVSNLHNFSFDVSWANTSRDLSPPLQRRTGHILSPARFPAASTPNPRCWKTLTLKEKTFTPPPKVKVSHKTIATYHDADRQALNRSQSFSPMELDVSEPSFHNDSKKSSSKLQKRHSDFGVAYDNQKSKNVPRMQKIPEPLTVRHRNINNNVSHDSSLEDSVFFRDSVKKDTSGASCHGVVARRPRLSTQDSMTKSSFLVLLCIILVSSCIVGYLYFQMGWCAVFDVDTVKLQHKLEDNVFGQHIAVKSVIEALEKFRKNIRERNGKRSLILSFHGWTGIGKNYISKFIAEAFYNAKISLYLAPLHLVTRYGSEKENGTGGIKSWILGNITRCGVNVIIVDEIDKAEVDHLRGIQSVIETLNREARRVSDGVVKMGPITVFLFLSNSRASQINHYLFSQMLVDRERELIRKSEFDNVFDSSTSEWYEDMKAKGLIDHFIPFLPLTEVHVKQCIERDFIKKGRDPSEGLILSVIEELSFVDMGGKNGQVSLTGCKRVQDKVNLHIDD
ncbi:torsin-1B-like [Mercenaria mercenaria]|uniref:torsin-1B-like n=1 Tax=Mercenaria mercenaria TaxID=6596 RepID=UPI00234E9086|nr:torsin-1B-like [Mercenaria mercenaria]